MALSIRGRLREIGGTAELISVPGQGTEVELKVPKTDATDVTNVKDPKGSRGKAEQR